MSVRWDREKFLQPITADQPCGESLEDTPLLASFDALRLFGESISPETAATPPESGKGGPPERKLPEWEDLAASAIEALSKSKDLRVLAYLGTALLRTDGLPAFFETITLASQWVESYWIHVYPLIDEDAVARKNALNCFADPMAVVERLRRVPLVKSRQHGNLSLRDIDVAGHTAPAGATEVRPKEAQINAAFAEMPLEQLTGLHQRIVEAMAALNSIDAKMRVEGGPEMAPSFDPLSAQLVKMNRLVRERLTSRSAGKEADIADAASAGEVGGSGGSTVPVGVVKSRQDAVSALEAVAEFFRRNEPSSPIPLFLDRAKRLVSKDFLEVLADVAPDALAQARAAGGVKKAE